MDTKLSKELHLVLDQEKYSDYWDQMELENPLHSI